MPDGPRFIAPDRHRRELAGFRAWCLLTAKHGRGVFAATPATLDTGTVHGPACPSCHGKRTIPGVRPYGACVTAEGGPTRYPCPRCTA